MHFWGTSSIKVSRAESTFNRARLIAREYLFAARSPGSYARWKSRDRSRGTDSTDVSLLPVRWRWANLSIGRPVYRLIVAWTRAAGSRGPHWEIDTQCEKRIRGCAARHYCKRARWRHTGPKINPAGSIHPAGVGCRNSDTWDVSWISAETRLCCSHRLRTGACTSARDTWANQTELHLVRFVSRTAERIDLVQQKD